MSKVGNVVWISMLLSSACATTPHLKVEPASPSSPPSPTEPADDSAEPEASAQDATGAQQGGDTLAQDRQEMTLDQSRRQILSERYIENARALIAELRYEDAEIELLHALDLVDSREARQLLEQVTSALGRVPGRQGQEFEDLRARQEIRIQQMQAQARDSLEQGRAALEQGDYDRAIAELSIANNQIRWSPYSIDWKGVDTEVASLLKEATERRTAAAQERRDRDREQAIRDLQEQERLAQERRQAIVENMLLQAIRAFEHREYDDAIDYCDQALHEDPRNGRAIELRDAAFRAGREAVRSDYILAKTEQFKRWREDLDRMRVPESEIYTLPDQDFWVDITEKRGKRRGLDLSQRDSATDRELRAKLSDTRIPGLKVADEESLTAVIDIVRTFTGLPLVVDPAAEAAATDAGVVFNFNFTSPLTVEQALNLITRMAGEEVAWTVRHDAVLVTTRLKARNRPVIYNHDVQDLVFGLTDFLGPRIDRLRLLDDMEDEDGGGPFGGIGEKPKLIEISALVTLITENVAVGSWEEEGVSISEGEGFIIIVHTPEVQEQVRKFLDDLRRFGSSLVTIESKFMTIASNWLQEIGVDFRGLDNPVFPFKDMDDVTNGLEDMASRGLDNNGLGAAAGIPSSGLYYNDGQDGDFKGRTENFFENPLGSALSTVGGITTQLTFLNDLEVSAILRAVEKSADFQLINNQVLSVHNTQRAYVSVINQQAYIQDFDVEVAQFQAVADPQINVLHEGVVLDVRPTIHHSRKYLTLEIQPTVARVVALRTFSSTLGGNTSPVEFQLPELEVQSVFTTAVIPDGGSILLGGLSNIRNIERRAEVPWLAKIPIVGFLLKNEGYDDENRSLMILIRAHITDVRDQIEQLEARVR
jgi:tetratricopeptide (TPR) repeat protein